MAGRRASGSTIGRASRTCRAEASGLHEVYARFDDEDEFIGRAIDDPLYAGERTGTRVAGHPIILSVLFDDDGVLRGLRFISDPRASPIERRMAHLLRLAIINHYDPAGWTCTDLAPEPGETPVGGVFLKQHCEKVTPERRMTPRGALPAQARPERHRPGDRRLHVGPVRELDPLRADGSELPEALSGSCAAKGKPVNGEPDLDCLMGRADHLARDGRPA